jgi:hypothetical protein
VADKKRLNDLRKKRDISRAYHDKEGSIADLATRFHASTATVQVAIKHDVEWWQVEVDKLVNGKVSLAPDVHSPTPYLHKVLQLVALHGKDGRPGYQVKDSTGVSMLMVEGTVDDVLDALSKDGWEVVQLVPGGGDWSDVVVRRAKS